MLYSNCPKELDKDCLMCRVEERLIAVVSELGLGSAAQAASLGSLVVPVWVNAAPAFLLEPVASFWGLSGVLAGRC